MASQRPESRHRKLLLVAILFTGVLLRVGVALYLGDSTPPGKDETSYSVLAMRLADGYGYSFPATGIPGFAAAGAPTSHWSFLYTGFAAGVYELFGDHPLAVRLLSALISGILMPWMLFRLGRRVWPEQGTLALLTAGLGAIYAYFVLYGAMVQTEAFFIITVLWSLERSLALLDAWENAETRRSAVHAIAVGLGISLGLATLLRQSILPWAAVSFVLLLGAGLEAEAALKRPLALFVAGLILMAFVVPFTIRNYVVYGDFLLLNSNAGYALYSAQHPLHGTSFEAFAAAPLPTDLEPMPQNEAEWDRALMARGDSIYH